MDFKRFFKPTISKSILTGLFLLLGLSSLVLLTFSDGWANNPPQSLSDWNKEFIRWIKIPLYLMYPIQEYTLLFLYEFVNPFFYLFTQNFGELGSFGSIFSSLLLISSIVWNYIIPSS